MKKDILLDQNIMMNKWTLKIVILVTLLGMLIANFILPLVEQQSNILASCTNFMINSISGVFIGFAFITMIFAGIEKGYVKKQTTKEWKLEDLPKISSQKATIKRGNVIAGIIFTILVMILFNVAPQFMGINHIEDGKLISFPIFNLETLKIVLPLFNVAMLLGMVRDIVKTIEGRYTKRISVIIVVLNLIALILSIVAFSHPNIINPNLLEGINQLYQNKVEDIQIITTLFQNFATFFLGVLGFAFAMDSIEAIYRAYRYDKE